jgi:hypothetical protein
VARSFVRDVADAVAAVALAKEQDWEYALPERGRPPAAVTISLDGTCMLMCEDGWREAMVGPIGLYDEPGQRLHTTYAAATPEYGKLTFLGRLGRGVDRVKAAYPDALYVGLADGAKDNWTYLGSKTSVQVVDFYHVTTYLWAAAEALFAGTPAAAEMCPWVDSWRHRLKHEEGAAAALIADLQARGAAPGKKRPPEGVEKALTYLRDQLKGGRLDYPSLAERHVPIGSGVTEAACKVLVKQRLCGSGMRWKQRGAAAVLSVRVLTYTPGRWAQFWGKVDRYGFPLAA